MKDGKHVILCVDDDADILQALRMILEKNGYLVHSAMDGEEAFKLYEKVRPDALIVDLMMENVDSGTSLAGRLKTAGNKVPIYMLSSVGDSLNTTVNSAALGLTGVFQKPIDAKSMVATLKATLKR